MDNNNLDSLLDDLQSSVGRVNGPGSTVHTGMATTGYREVSRTMTTQSTGQLPSTTREYQIEYLSPANSTTVAEERAPSPGALLNSTTEYSSGVDRLGNSTAAYKTMSYEYKSSSANHAGLLRDAADTMTQARAISDVNQSNVSELDTLLDDLNSAQRAGFSRDYQVSSSTSREGFDPAPLSRSQHVSRSSQRSYSSEQREQREQRYGSLNRDRQSPSPARHTSLDRVVAPKSSYTSGRDVTYSSTRTTSPSPVRRDVPPSPSVNRQIVQEIYRYESKGTGGTSQSSTTTTRYRDASPPRDRVRPPSPGAGLGGLPDYPVTGAAKVSTLVREYERRASREEQEAAAANLVRRSPSPAPARSPGPRRKMVTSTSTYNYSSSTSGRAGDPPRTPPPHRSPSPVSFPMHPEPYSFRREETEISNYSTHAHRSRSRSPQPQPFPVSRTVHTHHLEREERVHRDREPPMQPRPFPTPSPTPHEDQRPPKELNELMSSFSETDMSHTSVRQHALDLEQRSQRQTVVPVKTPPKSPSTPPAPPAVQEPLATRNVAGPPVYYPPGVEMFQHREESMQQSGGGGYKGKAKAKYEYKMKQRSKESSKTGKAVVPVCLPLCCAMPCEIM